MKSDAAKHDRKRWHPMLWSAAALMLALPAVAMQFSDEMAWDAADFIIFGGMLIAACGAYELATRWIARPAFRAVAGLAIASVFVLVWLELAVGLVGS
jgi:hypothetical protein